MGRNVDVGEIEKYMNREEWNTPDEKWWPERELGMILDSIPTADVVPVVHGVWIHKEGVRGVVFCSKCDFELRLNDTNYCPNCGAKMEVIDNG